MWSMNVVPRIILLLTPSPIVESYEVGDDVLPESEFSE